MTDAEEMLKFSIEHKIDFVFIGPEAPLSVGVADVLWQNNIPCIGPNKTSN
jgi:phosphoribosylamine--glycine ligase